MLYFLLKIILWPFFLLRQWVYAVYGPITEERRMILANRIDRRRFVPLLAHSLPRLDHQNGRNLAISSHWQAGSAGRIVLNVGSKPHDIATDGEFIWFTDIESADRGMLRMNRQASSVETVRMPTKCWGLAWDGKSIWVTHPETSAVSQIRLSRKKIPRPLCTISIKKNPNDPTEQLQPRAIIFAGNHVWVARRDGLTVIKVDSKKLTQIELNFTPMALAFDGAFIWMIHAGQDAGRVAWQLKKVDLQGREIPLQNAITITETPYDLVFDGTHLWITHEDGASQIDVNEDDVEGTASLDNALTGAAFDGMYLWAAEPTTGRVHRIDIQGRKQVSHVRPLERGMGVERHFSKACCDGTFLWLTDHVEVGGKTTGIIHRLLV